jgi:hypothetical protein
MMGDGGRSGTCAGHDELREIAIETRKDIQHLNVTMQDYVRILTKCEERVRHLEINGATICQKNATDLIDLEKRVDVVESNFDVIKGTEKQAGKVAALVAFLISVGIGVITIFWGK